MGDDELGKPNLKGGDKLDKSNLKGDDEFENLLKIYGRTAFFLKFI